MLCLCRKDNGDLNTVRRYAIIRFNVFEGLLFLKIEGRYYGYGLALAFIHCTMPKTTHNDTLLLFLLAILVLGSCGPDRNVGKEKTLSEKRQLTPLVNVFIGTERGADEHPGARGNTHPGATVPWGMVATVPQTFDFTKTQLATGYRDGMDSIYGFSCVNFSGIGCPAGGSVPLKFSSGPFAGGSIGSTFSEQRAHPGYYSVRLTDAAISVETTTTTRSAIFRLQLPKGQSNVFLDLTAQQGHVKGGEVLDYTANAVQGYQLEGFFCGADTMGKTFFYTEMEQEADTVYVVYNNKRDDKFGHDLSEKPSGIVFEYQNKGPTTLQLKVGVSFVSETKAKKNLNTEQSGFAFDSVREKAGILWENELGKIRVSGGRAADETVFYTALYHSLLMPMTFSDADGEFVKQGSRNEIGKAEGYVRYTGFSLWDTYRTVHPLLSLAYPKRQSDMVRSMLGMYQEAGRLPKWEVFAQEPNIMVGDPAAIVIADTHAKGITDFDVALAYRAMTDQADRTEHNMMRRGLREYLDLGYIAMDGDFGNVADFQWKNGVVWGAVSTTMEFNLADYGIAQMAKRLQKKDDYQRYWKRAHSFLKLYDADTGFIRPKNRDGSWYEPFDPERALWDKMNFGLRGGPGYVEGAAWNYLFSIPHAIDTLQKTMGNDRFLKQLNAIFDEGHFDMTNEPGLGFPFMYNHTPLKHTKTASLLHQCLRTYFRNAHNGLPGNDDAGTMSAWVVFAMLGIYPHTPGSPEYTLTVPTFEKAVLQLDPEYYQGESIQFYRKGPKFGRISKMTRNGIPFDFWQDHNVLTSEKSTVIIYTDTLEREN